MEKNWGWLVQYVVAIFLALLLGAILGGLPLFQDTSLGDTRLLASHTVQFLAYGGALILFWLLGRRVALQASDDTASPLPIRLFLRQLTPLVTLIAVLVGYKVLLLIGDPFLDRTAKMIYNWVFVVGIIGVGTWLTWTWFHQSAPLADLLESVMTVSRPIPALPSLPCHDCGGTITFGMKYCGQCGGPIDRPA